MSDNKNVLHKNKLEAFMDWLDKNRIQHRPGKGAHQVLQVLTDAAGWQVIFDHEREDSIHYTVNEKLMKTVRRFIRETKRDEPPVVAVSPRAQELVAALDGLLAVINEDKDGTYFICGEAKEAIDYAHQVLEKV